MPPLEKRTAAFTLGVNRAVSALSVWLEGDPRLGSRAQSFDSSRDSLKESGCGSESRKRVDVVFPDFNVRVRMGPGPVFAYEWLTTTRRWQLYALRAIFVSSLLIGMMVVWHFTSRRESPGQTVSIDTLASYGEEFYLTIVSIELTLVLLAAPAATAGAVCLDKARGTLDHLLATDLSDAEIVLGKLGVRLVPVVGLIACVLPIMAPVGAPGRDRPERAFWLVPDGHWLRGAGLLAGLLAIGLGTKDSRSLDADVPGRDSLDE